MRQRLERRCGQLVSGSARYPESLWLVVCDLLPLHEALR